MTIDILSITANFGHCLDILTFDFLLKPPQLATGLFSLKPPQPYTGLFLDILGHFLHFFFFPYYNVVFLLRATQTHLQYIELALRTRLQDLLLMGWFDYNFIDKHYGDVLQSAYTAEENASVTLHHCL